MEMPNNMTETQQQIQQPAEPEAAVVNEAAAPEAAEKPRRGRKPAAAKAETDAAEKPRRGRKPAAAKAEADAAAEKPKRGRKPAAKAEADAVTEKPKRGRKPAAAKAEADAVTEKPKRGRKPAAAKAEADAAEEKPKRGRKPSSRRTGPLRVLMAASECAPFLKTGGLADVMGALPQVLVQKGVDVRVMMPLYSAIPQKWRQQMQPVTSFYIQLGWRRQYCGILSLVKDGVTYYFIDNEYYFARSYIYGDYNNDEGERFGFFSKAVLESMTRLDFIPDILHAHDWQAAMSVSLLRMQYRYFPEYRDIRTVFTIHNLRYQGIFEWPFMDELLSIGHEHYTGSRLEYYGGVNFLKGALVYSDKITTVSPTYAEEIQTPAYGETLDGVLRWRAWDIHGILNGIDEAAYDPATDSVLPANFSAADMGGKAECRAALRRELGLSECDKPILGIVTRFTNQKGLDLIEAGITGLMEKGVQLAVLGNGDSRYEHLFSWASWKYPGMVSARYLYDPALANRIYAGSDMFLMPSQFEPCGLAQLIALRYGTIPIVRETGGLKDSITPYNKFSGEGLGFTFSVYNHIDLLGAVDRALDAYTNPEAWQKLIANAMNAHFTWDLSADKYIELYKELILE